MSKDEREVKTPLDLACDPYDRGILEEVQASQESDPGLKRLHYKAAWSYADSALVMLKELDMHAYEAGAVAYWIQEATDLKTRAEIELAKLPEG